MVRLPITAADSKLSITVVRGDIWLAGLDPTIGVEIQKTRPCVIISPPDIHDYLRIVLVAPMTTGSRSAPFRVPVHFERKTGLILLDQIRALDKRRLVKRMGVVDDRTMQATFRALQAMFTE
jgi:mRNA interferase MazF